MQTNQLQTHPWSSTCWSILIKIVHKWYCGWTPCSWHLFSTLQQLEKLGGAQVTGDLRANSWLLWPAPAGGQRQECHPKTAVRIIKIASGSMSNPTVGYANLKLFLSVSQFPLSTLGRSQLSPTAVCWWHCWSTGDICLQSGRGAWAQHCCNQSVRCALAWIFILSHDNS